MTSDTQRACKYGDKFCPCQDGDPCNYEGKNPMTPPSDTHPTAGERSMDEQKPQTDLYFRKLPVVIEAWRIEFENRPGPDWVEAAFSTEAIDWCPSGEGLWVNTLEGAIVGGIGDMLIRSVKGELYPCRADIFAATYERAALPAAAPAAQPVAPAPVETEELNAFSREAKSHGARVEISRPPISPLELRVPERVFSPADTESVELPPPEVPNTRLTLPDAPAAQPVCAECKGSGMRDSGGTMPWGEPALVPCDCVPAAQPVEPSAQDAELTEEEEAYADGRWDQREADAVNVLLLLGRCDDRRAGGAKFINVLDVYELLGHFRDEEPNLAALPAAQPVEPSALADAILTIPCDTKATSMPISRGYHSGWRRALIAAAALAAAPDAPAAQPVEPSDDARDAAKYRALNTPEIVDFTAAVEREAMHQRDRWAASGDAGKSDADWFWLIGYLAGKGLGAKTEEKRLHHIITTAAACLNWHGARVGAYIDMRPGIADPEAALSAPKEPSND